MTGVVVSLWLAIKITGTGSCPAAADVDEKLAPLLPAGFASSCDDQVSIAEDSDGTLSVSLARPDGRSIASRRLPPAATCDEQAETVAVALAVWEAQVHPEISLRLDHLTVASAPPPAVGAAANPGLVLRRADRGPDHSATTPVPTSRTWALGAGLVGSRQPGSIAPGGRLDAMLGTASSPWRARLSAAGLGKHKLDLAPGQAAWWRLYLALGVDYALPVGRRWEVAFGAAGVLGVATAEGVGYSTNRTARSTDLGAEAQVRVNLRLGGVRPWLGLALVTWLRRQTLEVTGLPTSLVLPRTEPMLALGTDFFWPP